MNISFKIQAQCNTKCLKYVSGVPQRVNGKVLGNLNGVDLKSADLHTYVVTSDGRAYTAISRVDPSLGTSMLSLYTVGSVFGWLFGAPTSPTGKNGYAVTGESNNTLQQSFLGTPAPDK